MYKDDPLLLFAHEMKDALSRLGGYLYLLKNNIITENENNILIQRLEEEFHDNEHYMNELLVWAKERRKTEDTKTSETNLLVLVNAVLKSSEIKNIALSKHIEIAQKTPNIHLKIDKTLYNIILKNMLRNALKFSGPHSNIAIEVALVSDNIITSVTDQGIGINTNNLSDIEHLPTRASAIGEKGSGIALSLCKEILKLEKGELWATNNADKGTSFFFSLPFYQ